MACPTCDHTMHRIGVCRPPYESVPVFWCPRCGTLKANAVTEKDEVPYLVGNLIERFERLGLRESISDDGVPEWLTGDGVAYELVSAIRQALAEQTSQSAGPAIKTESTPVPNSVQEAIQANLSSGNRYK